jgi:hypothetical protein
MTGTRLAAAALATLGAASAIPIPLAQLDFAGFWNVFDIDSGDSPRALHIIMGVGGVLTIAVLALAFIGAALAAMGNSTARSLLIAAALAGLVTAMPLWVPAGIVIGAAALLLGHPNGRPDPASGRPAWPTPDHG